MTYQFPLYCFCFAVACIFVNIYAPGCTKGHPPNLRSPFSSLTGSLRYMALKEKIMVNPSIQLSKFLLYTITSRLFCQVFSSSADLISAHFPDIILSKHLHHPINCSQYPAGDNAVQDHWACNGKDLAAHTKNFSFSFKFQCTCCHRIGKACNRHQIARTGKFCDGPHPVQTCQDHTDQY